MPALTVARVLTAGGTDLGTTLGSWAHQAGRRPRGVRHPVPVWESRRETGLRLGPDASRRAEGETPRNAEIRFAA